LFTPFFTTKEPGEGTGLGLSITYSIVEAHGGHITVVRPLEGGAAFVVDLPAAPQEFAAATTPAGADAAAAPPPSPPAPPATKRVILLVDDDPAVRRMVKALFGREGHTVDVARNPQQALDLARTRAYDLILADAQARARDDLFVARLLESHPALKDRVLVSTGEGRPTPDDAVARLGLRHVRKPFNLRDLRDEAARVWAGRPGTAAAARP
jgi:CheY-like chemotaxis protein